MCGFKKKKRKNIHTHIEGGAGAKQQWSAKSLGKRPRIVKMFRGPAAILILSKEEEGRVYHEGRLRRFSNRGRGFATSSQSLCF